MTAPKVSDETRPCRTCRTVRHTPHGGGHPESGDFYFYQGFSRSGCGRDRGTCRTVRQTSDTSTRPLTGHPRHAPATRATALDLDEGRP